MRRLAVLFLCALPLLGAESYPLGRTDLAPAPGVRWMVRGASSGGGHLAVWIDSRDGRPAILATRLDADGSPLDGEGLRIDLESPSFDGLEIAVATDGRDYLMAWNDRTLRIARVTSEGTLTVRPAEPAAKPLALVSNGRSYLLLYVERDVPKGRLLDASGAPISGAIVFPSGTMSAAATRNGRYFVTHEIGATYALGVVRGGILGEGAFPPRGRGRAVTLRPLPQLFDRGWDVRAGADERGLYTVRRTASSLDVAYQRHDDETGQPLGAPIETTLPRGEPRRIVATTAGDALYLAVQMYGYEYSCYQADPLLLRVSANGAAEPVELPGGDAVVRFSALLLRGASGPLLVWTDHRHVPHCSPSSFGVPKLQMYAAVLGDPSWSSGGELLSRSRRIQTSPRIAAGRRGHLAIWRETDARDSLVARLIGRDGRPLSIPLVLAANVRLDDYLVAFDGIRFLVVWDDGDVWGQFVDGGGARSGDPFLIDGAGSGLASLLWDEGQYIVTHERAAIRLDRAGARLDGEPIWTDWLLYYLTPCDSCEERYVGLRVQVNASMVSAGPPYWAYYDAVSTPEISEWRLPRYESDGPGLDGVAWSRVAPAIAAGNGKLFAVVDGIGLNVFPNDDPLPYPAPERLTGQWAQAWVAKRMQAAWNGNAFVVAAAGTLALHDADGRLLQHQPITADAADGAFALDGPGAVTVVYERGMLGTSLPRVEATRIELP